jgi:hypothetical protein
MPKYLSSYLIFFLLIFTSVTHASIIEISFSGLVSGQDDIGIIGLPGESYTTVIASGHIRYDTTIAPADSQPLSRYGRYENSPNNWLDISVSVNGVTLNDFEHNVVSYQSILIENSSEPSAIPDSIIIQEGSNNGVTNGDPLTNFYNAMNFRFDMNSSIGDLIDSDVLSEDIGNYTDVGITFGATEIFPDGSMTGRAVQTHLGFTSIDRVTISSISVPEPSTFVILALGVIALSLSRFKKQS